ncbi:MAG: hypothetical protein OQJ77_05435 [Thiovulaceae bacterium]|nr:hypothetical protein [Sulfurimonadaceae bacterium]MCW9026739.1 hypothetical protein [Sulfurimonadaceae bacterium]
MKKESYELFKSASMDEILNAIESELKTRNESPFWSDKVIPFSKAILSVLIVLRDENRLFTPEDKKVDELTPELFLSWSDFVSLKSLFFKVENVDVNILAEYLHRYNVNLENESLDFPIANYNLHQGVSNVIKSLL